MNAVNLILRGAAVSAAVFLACFARDYFGGGWLVNGIVDGSLISFGYFFQEYFSEPKYFLRKKTGNHSGGSK